LDYLVHFAYPIFLWVGVIIFLIALVIRHWLTKKPVYLYPLAGQLIREKFQSRHPYRKIFAFLRFSILVLLVLLVGKPQLVDTTSKAIIKGINIMVVLDVSGSMDYQDYADDDRTRFEVAQAEAIRFIQARPNDAIGLVLFGKDALTRCPLTLDKKMLKSIVEDTKLGIVNPDGTVLARGIVAAANRLKNSKAKSNVMIVLTDGEPSQDDIDPAIAIEVAKQLGIKIYTIGIGSGKERLFMHPLYGLVPLGKVNIELLERLAKETSGKFFLARDANEMRAIYDTIDKLEKSEYEAPLYTKYYDIFMPFAWGLLALLLMEIILASTLWFSI
jgi:Ca-activated chloride channel family protein